MIASPSGEAGPIDLELPFTQRDVDEFLSTIGRPRQRIRSGARPNLRPTIESFGAKLFGAVFRDQIRIALATSLEATEAEDAGLRIRLRLTDAPELADLPWEFIYDPSAARFLALSGWTPLVRYLELPGSIRPLTISAPLRILVMEASPVDLDALDSTGEIARLREALADLIAADRVVIDEEPTGTLAGLQRQLRNGDYHVFHFIGHGEFDEAENDGVLYFEGPKRRSQAIAGRALGELLHDHRSLRLAVLNACEGARSGREDPFAGTAQSLVRQGFPAVVAMQFEITDAAAITFARSLYEAVADGYPLDASMAEARKSVRNMPNPIEWATPVLHMRAGDGRVFAVDASSMDTHRRDEHVSTSSDTTVPPAVAGERSPLGQSEAPLSVHTAVGRTKGEQPTGPESLRSRPPVQQPPEPDVRPASSALHPTALPDPDDWQAIAHYVKHAGIRSTTQILVHLEQDHLIEARVGHGSGDFIVDGQRISEVKATQSFTLPDNGRDRICEVRLEYLAGWRLSPTTLGSVVVDGTSIPIAHEPITDGSAPHGTDDPDAAANLRGTASGAAQVESSDTQASARELPKALTGRVSYLQNGKRSGTAVVRFATADDHIVVWERGLLGSKTTVDGEPVLAVGDVLKFFINGTAEIRSGVLVTKRGGQGWPSAVPRVVSLEVDGAAVALVHEEIQRH
ncbi:CHAT domain-containing protein [Microbacterium sp.]|uniref:CHAT domain-containing protein n=1 Tax=Microbacterium sp. TaxID=51671 RepID=UPI0026175550|nr:CHAT domain-containing protein [Microbacterium sp.]